MAKRNNISINEKERILWVGHPKFGILFRKGELVYFIFGLWNLFIGVFFLKLLFNSVFLPFNLPAYFISLIPIYFGLYYILLRFIFDTLERTKTKYYVTSTRVLIKSRFIFRKVKIICFDEISYIRCHETIDKSGDIVFYIKNSNYIAESFNRSAFWPFHTRLNVFEGINNVRQVHDILISALAENQSFIIPKNRRR